MPAQVEQRVPTIEIIDDDGDVREALRGLFRSLGYEVDLFDSVQNYMARRRADCHGCMVLDVRLPGKSGLEFQEDLNRANIVKPIIFISGHADIAMSVRAMKAGAVEFLTKPVREQDLLDAVQLAIEKDCGRRQMESTMASLRSNYAMLTQRERDIMARVVIGRRNKQIADDVGLTEATVKMHRGQIMRKMNANSLVDLVRVADAISNPTKV